MQNSYRMTQLFSAFSVEFLMNLAEVRVGNMRINLGSIDGSVTEELLDGTDVSAIVEKVCSEDVAKDVRRDFFRDAGFFCTGLDESFDGARREARGNRFTARNIYEKCFRHVLAGL